MITLNGQDFHLHQWGDSGGRPLVMLHGFPEYGGAWNDVARYLPGWRCIAPDQRGYGRSWAPAAVAEYEIRALVGDIAALIERLGAPVPLVAHDWGAAVAYALAIWRPELVSALVVLNGVHPGPFQRELARGGAQSAASAYIEYLRDPRAEVRLSRDGFDGLRRLFAAGMDMGWLSGERCWMPIAPNGRGRGADRDAELVSRLAVAGGVAGATDHRCAHVLPPAQGQVRMSASGDLGRRGSALLPCSIEGLEAYCPDLQVERIATADHWILHQQPDRAADLILKFLTAPD